VNVSKDEPDQKPPTNGEPPKQDERREVLEEYVLALREAVKKLRKLFN
jgi:hypothetical protein